jgi:hypothetical protein
MNRTASRRGTKYVVVQAGRHGFAGRVTTREAQGCLSETPEISLDAMCLLSGKAFTLADRGEFAMKGFDDAVRLQRGALARVDMTHHGFLVS